MTGRIPIFGSAIALFLLAVPPAIAHHPFGGKTPANFIEGILSGMGHPIIGPDHFAFIVAIGLLAALKGKQGIFLPVAFVLATVAGTIVHLFGLDLPAPELVISASVLTFGVFLAIEESPNWAWLAGSAAIAGLFHGYAYGEAIVGAEMTPLVAYLVGFALIQLAIALAAFKIANLALKKVAEQPALALRFAGFTISGIGAAFLSSVILD
ncbi:MAG: HupE/UreJ family protein [Cyanobacteria bacterium SBLK]|nr:HupE/UreJ family protein [Cyanobacteria bacterium SBLK]